MRRIDAQDVFLVSGVILIVGGIAAWSFPAASIVLGLIFLGFVVMISRTAVAKPEGKR